MSKVKGKIGRAEKEREREREKDVVGLPKDHLQASL